MLAAEAAYCALEDDLQHYLDTYESTHDYDEYHFDLDEIEHDPYVLLSLLCALHEGQWTIGEVQGTLQMLFDRQYIFTEDVVVETRYRTETDTWTDEDGNSHTDIYQVPYDYYICTVTLENFDLSHVPVYVMGEDQLSRYAIYMATLGNRPDLFPDSPYVNKYITGKPGDYEVPENIWTMKPLPRCLPKRRNTSAIPMCGAAVLPATSFDCSGYVSWVINHSGWNVGRLGAQGLYNICTPTSSPKPGDLVFFKGTYDTPGVSHCGIYVGDGKNAALRRSHRLRKFEYKLLAISFLRLRAFTVTGGFEMATTKSMKIQAEIDKVKAKISEQQARLKELEQKKLEAENSEIVDIVRGMSISLTELSAAV